MTEWEWVEMDAMWLLSALRNVGRVFVINRLDAACGKYVD